MEDDKVFYFPLDRKQQAHLCSLPAGKSPHRSLFQPLLPLLSQPLETCLTEFLISLMYSEESSVDLGQYHGFLGEVKGCERFLLDQERETDGAIWLSWSTWGSRVRTALFDVFQAAENYFNREGLSVKKPSGSYIILSTLLGSSEALWFGQLFLHSEAGLLGNFNKYSVGFFTSQVIMAFAGNHF